MHGKRTVGLRGKNGHWIEETDGGDGLIEATDQGENEVSLSR